MNNFIINSILRVERAQSHIGKMKKKSFIKIYKGGTSSISAVIFSEK